MAIEVTSTLASSYHGSWLAERMPQVVAQPQAPAGPSLKKVRLLRYRFRDPTRMSSSS